MTAKPSKPAGSRKSTRNAAVTPATGDVTVPFVNAQAADAAGVSIADAVDTATDRSVVAASIPPVAPVSADADGPADETKTAPELTSDVASAASQVQAPAADTPATASQAAPNPVSESTMTDVNKMNEQISNATAQAAGNAQAAAGEINDRAKQAMERSARLVEDFNDFSKGNIEALVESSKAAARHAEALSQQTAEFGRKTFEQTSAAIKEMASVKSPTDLFRLQSEFAKNAFDQLVAESSRNSEAMLKAAGDVFQPLSNRFAVAAEKMKIGG